MSPGGSAASFGRVAPRWIAVILGIVAPPGLTPAAIAGIWVASLAAEGRRGLVLAAGLSLVALGGNVVLYAGL